MGGHGGACVESGFVSRVPGHLQSRIAPLAHSRRGMSGRNRHVHVEQVREVCHNPDVTADVSRHKTEAAAMASMYMLQVLVCGTCTWAEIGVRLAHTAQYI